MKLRAATLADAKDIAHIHATNWRSTYQRELAEEYLKNLVPGERLELWTERLESPKPGQHVILAELERRSSIFDLGQATHMKAYGMLPKVALCQHAGLFGSISINWWRMGSEYRWYAFAGLAGLAAASASVIVRV